MYGTYMNALTCEHEAGYSRCCSTRHTRLCVEGSALATAPAQAQARAQAQAQAQLLWAEAVCPPRHYWLR